MKLLSKKSVPTKELSTYSLEKLWNYLEEKSPGFKLRLTYKNKNVVLKKGEDFTKLEKLGIFEGSVVENTIDIVLSHKTFDYSDIHARFRQLPGCCGYLLLYDMILVDFIKGKEHEVGGLLVLKLVEQIAIHCNYTAVLATHVLDDEDTKLLRTCGFVEQSHINNVRTNNDVGLFVKETGCTYDSDEDEYDDYDDYED